MYSFRSNRHIHAALLVAAATSSVWLIRSLSLQHSQLQDVYDKMCISLIVFCIASFKAAAAAARSCVWSLRSLSGQHSY